MKTVTRFLALLVLTAVLLLIFLCFFQFPSMDDYVGSYLEKYYGLPGAIRSYLTNGNGRFSTIPIFLGISSSPVLMNNYALLLLFFMAIAFGSFYLFIRIIGKHFFPGPGILASIGITGLMLVVFLSSMPEVASFFYWMATGVTYLFPFCLFLLLLACYSYLLRQNQKKKWVWLVLTCLLTAVLAGANEVMLFYTAALPFLVGFIFFASRQKIPGLVWFLMAYTIVIVLVALQVPGNVSRTHEYSQKQYVGYSMVGAFYRTIQNLLPIFTNPLFYISCLGVFIISGNLKPEFTAFLKNKRTNWIIESGLLLVMVYVFHVVIRQIGATVVPLRAVNIINCLVVLGCWWIILMNSHRLMPIRTVFLANARHFRLLFLYAFSIAFLFSGFFFDLVQNVVTAPIHAKILKRRELSMQHAKANGINTVVVQPYEQEASIILDSLFPSKKRFIKEEFLLPPSFSHFMDEPHRKVYAFFYAEYFGIDTVVGNEGKVWRWGLKEGGDPWR